MQKKKNISLSTESQKSYSAALLSYHPAQLEKEPTTPTQIYEYYSYVDKLYVWLKNAYKDDLCVLCNEMRAIIGHLAEYNESTESTCHNLSKAYGHIRRLSIDTLKVACNGFDLEFTGFDNADFEEMEFDFRTGGDVAPVDVVEDDFTVDDELETDIVRGDLFKLGNHYLLCGDATLEEDVIKLMSASGERERERALI